MQGEATGSAHDSENQGQCQRVELEEASIRDYAAEQQMTANAAGVRLFRAREALKRRLIHRTAAVAVTAVVPLFLHLFSHPFCEVI